MAGTPRRRKSSPTTLNRKSAAKTAKSTSAAQAPAADPVVQELQARIAAGKIIFDFDKQRKELLGLSTGTRVTRKLQSLVLKVSDLAGQQIRISSVVRNDGGHHGRGRAFDIGNEEIARTLMPRVATNAQVAALEIDEIIFDATIAGEANRNKWNYDLGVKHNYNSVTLN